MIKIIDYKAGNAPSVAHAVTRLGFEAGFARRPDDLLNATRIILPGVGSARATMDSLREMNLIGALEEAVLKRKILFLGICVGMQILFEHSEEEDTGCLGWLKGRVVKFDAANVRVPQMGWNRVTFHGGRTSSSATAHGDVRPPSGFFYFVNSFYAKPQDPADVWGVADYGGAFCAAVRRDNIRATQFHTEKSGEAGLALLNSFLKEAATC